MKALKYITLVFAVCAVSAGSLQAQTTKEQKKAEKIVTVKKLLDSKKYVFVAQYANPQGGGVTTLNGRLINITPNVNGNTGHVYLTSSYDVKVRPDSVISFLPYFGRVTFDAPYNQTDGGVKFTSTKFGYKAKDKKKGSTEIDITPQDAKYIQRLSLSVAPEGSAVLNLTIANRSYISYDGYIAEKN